MILQFAQKNTTIQPPQVYTAIPALPGPVVTPRPKTCTTYSDGTMTWGEVAQVAKSEPPALISGLIPAKSLGIFVGQYGIGKSPFAIQMQMSVAIGSTAFLSMYKTSTLPKTSLYVDFENGATGALNIANNIARFFDLSTPPKTCRVFSPNYSCPGDSGNSVLQRITDAILTKNYKLVIIDPLRGFWPRAEESNTDAARLIQYLRKLIRESGASILLVHHPRKASSDPRYQAPSLVNDPHSWMMTASGASALVQNVDFRIGLQQDPAGEIVFRCFSRNVGWGPSLYLQREYDPVTEEPIGYRLQNNIDRLDPTERKHFDKLNQTFTTKDARTVRGRSANPTDQWLDKLVRLQVIRKVSWGNWEKLE